MFKKSILLFLISVFVLGAGLMAQTHKDFLPFYYLRGAPQLPDNLPLTADREVYFFKDNIDNAIIIKTDVHGKFEMNVWDLYYLNDGEAEIAVGQDVYRIAVKNDNPANPAQGYGADPAFINWTEQFGYTETSPHLVLNKGILLKIDVIPLPDGKVNDPYNGAIKAVNKSGTGPYSWDIVVGTLPDGLSGIKVDVDGDGDLDFRISGIPAKNGSWTFKIKLTDSTGVYTQKEFTITIKEGAIIPVVDDGPVILEIFRVSPDIMVKWKFNPAYNLSANTPVDIYALGGSGSGSFVQAYDPLKWVKIVSGAIAGQPLENKTITINSILMDYVVDPSNPNNKHVRVKNQVGVASTHKELYFKALPATGDYSSPDQYLPKVMSVGKVDYAFAGGNTFFNIPFINSGPVNEVFSNQGFTNGTRVMVFNYSNESFGYSTFTNGLWDNAIGLKVGEGYIFTNTDYNDVKDITLVGKVPFYPQSISIKKGSNLIGLPFPYKLKLNNAGFSPKVGDRLLINNRNKENFGFYDCSQAGSFNGAIADPDNPGQTIPINNFYMKARIGYWYSRDPLQAEFNWAPSAP